MNSMQQKILRDNADAKLQKLVYIGCRRGAKSKRVFGYVPIEDVGMASEALPLSDSEALYWKKSLYPGTAGTIIEVVLETKDGHTTIWKAVDYVGRWPVVSDNVKWQAEHDEVMADLDSKKDAMHDSILETLQPIAKAYRRQSRAGRAVLLAKVIRYLTAAAWD